MSNTLSRVAIALAVAGAVGAMVTPIATAAPAHPLHRANGALPSQHRVQHRDALAFRSVPAWTFPTRSQCATSATPQPAVSS